MSYSFRGGDLLYLFIVEEREVTPGIGVLIVVIGLNQIMIKVLLNQVGNFVKSVEQKPRKKLVGNYNIKIKLVSIILN
jgi:hypothetical protein